MRGNLMLSVDSPNIRQTFKFVSSSNLIGTIYMSNTKHFKLTYSRNHCRNNSWCFLAYKCDGCSRFIISLCSSKYAIIPSQLFSMNQCATFMSFFENDSPRTKSPKGRALQAKTESFSFLTPPSLLRKQKIKSHLHIF